MPDYRCNFGALPYTAVDSATFAGRFILTTFAAAATFFLLTEVVAGGKILRMELAFIAVAVGVGVKVRNRGPQVSRAPRNFSTPPPSPAARPGCRVNGQWLS